MDVNAINSYHEMEQSTRKINCHLKMDLKELMCNLKEHQNQKKLTNIIGVVKRLTNNLTPTSHAHTEKCMVQNAIAKWTFKITYRIIIGTNNTYSHDF